MHHVYFGPRYSPDDRWKDQMVTFFHPAYSDQNPPLLALTAIDLRDNSEFGINFDTARAACGIVAANRWDAGTYFAEKNERENGETVWTRVERPPDGVLPAGPDYYFIVDTPENRYPVVPNFHHWRFPHDALPDPWARLCRAGLGDEDHVTDASGAEGSGPAGNGPRSMNYFKNTCLAGVAPFSHRLWLERNKMERYSGLQGVDGRIMDQTNISPLRHGINANFHKCSVELDPQIRPKRRYELHPLLNLSAIVIQGGSTLQDGPWLLPGVHIRSEHLFARFAFNILSRDNYRFLSGAGKYSVRLFDIETGEQYTAELHSRDIAEQSRILRPRRIAESVDFTEEDEDLPQDPYGSSTDETSEDEAYYCDRTRGRRPSPRSLYGPYPYGTSQQHQASAQDAGPAPTQHASSMASLSISSTVSASPFQTPVAEPLTGNDGPSNYTADEIGFKRQNDEWEDNAMSRSPKRRRIDT
ncbi:hypothetical protein F5Y14DRAFT_115878 [Nemania sp. NC0429]|nr:hypothetical protein F5Y14DRAFT_115878 [Nemania sp. NC0429]